MKNNGKYSPIIKHNTITYLIVNCLTTLAMSMPHAVLTIVLFSKGLTLSQIMLVQISYSLAVLLSEYPSGLIADMYSKKKVFIASRIFLLIMIIVVIYGQSLAVMCCAWFIYGLGSALDSGTLDSDIINLLKLGNDNQQISHFISLGNRLDFIAMLVGSTVGSWLYYRIGIDFYWISFLAIVLAIVITTFEYKMLTGDLIKKKQVTLKNEIILGLEEIKKSSEMKLMVALTFVSQFFFQAHYQLWQGLFLSKGFNKKHFYLIYIVFQLISFVAYGINLEKCKLSSTKHVSKLCCCFGIIMFICILFLNIFSSVWFVLGYLILVFSFTFLEYYCSVLFSSLVSLERISSLTSLRSSIGRIASIISMCLLSLLLLKLNALETVTINFVLAIVFSGLIIVSIVKEITNNKLEQ